MTSLPILPSKDKFQGTKHQQRHFRVNSLLEKGSLKEIDHQTRSAIKNHRYLYIDFQLQSNKTIIKDSLIELSK